MNQVSISTGLLDYEKISKVHRQLRFLKNGMTRKVISIISKNPGINQVGIMVKLRYMEQGPISNMASLLVKYRVITKMRDGKSIRHYLNPGRLEEINKAFSKFSEINS